MEPTKENLDQKEITIPKETARALGRGLRQLLDQPLQKLNPYINNLKNAAGVDQHYVQAMETSIEKTLGISTKLEKAKEVKIVPGRLDFAFSAEEIPTEEQRALTQSDIIIDDSTTPPLGKLTGAMQHNFNNAFMILVGFPEMIGESAQDATTKQQAEELASRCQSIFNAINLIQTEDYQLIISTDATGSTTIYTNATFSSRPKSITS